MLHYLQCICWYQRFCASSQRSLDSSQKTIDHAATADDDVHDATAVNGFHGSFDSNGGNSSASASIEMTHMRRTSNLQLQER
jgi:hypothetical protein